MELISVGAHPYKIKKQNSKMYYTIFTEPYKYFRRGFLQSYKKITKSAVVYLPFGYDENEKYNVYYLMHGWTGHAGDFFEHSNILNILTT